MQGKAVHAFMIDLFRNLSLFAAEATAGAAGAAGAAGTNGAAGGPYDASAGVGSLISMGLSMVVLFVVFYFFLIRPQRNEQKKKDALMNSVAVGDSVLTTAGFYGVVIDMQDDTVIVEFGNNKNCRIPMQKSAIVQVEKPEDAVDSSAE